MDVDGLPIIGPGVDYTKVGAIHQKRTLAFINHFLSNTVSFLNKFSRSCEVKLEKFEMQIQKLEASLSILEAKLSSIPGLDSIPHPSEISLKDGPVATIEDVQPQSILPPIIPAETDTGGVVPSMAIQTKTEANSETLSEAKDISKVNGPKVSQDPRYSKYFRMVQVGVPPPAVRLKMKQEGLDPSILDNPDALSSPKLEHKEDSLSEDDSESSFSD